MLSNFSKMDAEQFLFGQVFWNGNIEFLRTLPNGNPKISFVIGCVIQISFDKLTLILILILIINLLNLLNDEILRFYFFIFILLSELEKRTRKTKTVMFWPAGVRRSWSKKAEKEVVIFPEAIMFSRLSKRSAIGVSTLASGVVAVSAPPLVNFRILKIQS